MHLGCCSTFGKRKNTLACGSSIFTLSESLATSLVHGSRNPARKTIRYSFITTHSRNVAFIFQTCKLLAECHRGVASSYFSVRINLCCHVLIRQAFRFLNSSSPLQYLFILPLYQVMFVSCFFFLFLYYPMFVHYLILDLFCVK
jgi:hypothetical protein